jgi:hypothetical protein
MEISMKKLTLTALALMSTSAFATDARTAAHQGNAAFADSIDYRTYYSLTDNGKESMYFDLMAGGAMSGAFRKSGHSLHVSQMPAAEDGLDAGTSLNYFAADGDTGYSVGLDYTSKDRFSLGGGYGMTDGNSSMAFSGNVSMVGVEGADDEGVGVAVGVSSRDLGDDDVTVWGASVDYGGIVDKESGATGTSIGGNYGMGWRYSTDRSKAGVTVGPSLSVGLPEDGDTMIGISLADINVAGEFALNDWFGLRGSVTNSLAVVNLTGDDDPDLSTAGMAAAFGASIDFEGADVDLVIDPNSVLNGPYFLTGAASAPAIMMSARFDI